MKKWNDLGAAFEAGRRDLPQIAVDGEGVVHVAGFGGHYNRLDEGRWNEPTRLPSPGGGPLGYPDLAVDPWGRVWAAYDAGPAVQREGESGESEILLYRIGVQP